jgi:hypothetical protein
MQPMADAPDLVGAWRDAANQLRSLATSIAGQAGAGARDVLGPLQRQTEVIEQLLRRQIEVEEELVRRALAPARATVEALDKAPDAMRAQAAAFRAAATSFGQAADLLEVQATAVEQTIGALKAPVELTRKAARRGAKPE